MQVDAFIALVAAFHPTFQMYWTRENIVHQRLLHISTILEGCLKCYLPANPLFYLLYCIGLILFLCMVARRLK